MANVNTKALVLVRDGFICRYCGARLLLPQAVKVLDIHDPLKGWHWHPNTKLEPLRSKGATVDHIIPESEGGYDSPKNLVACCNMCNPSKGKGHRSLLPQSLDKSWDGGSCIFLTLATKYKQHLSSEDVKWLKALTRERIVADNENIQAKIDAMTSSLL